MKFWLYLLVICCFNTKEGVIAILLATTNAIIFLWRT